MIKRTAEPIVEMEHMKNIKLHSMYCSVQDFRKDSFVLKELRIGKGNSAKWSEKMLL